MHLLSLPAPVGSHHADLLMRLKRYHNQLNTPGRISNCYIITSIGAVNPFIGPYAKSAHFDTAASFEKRTGTLTGKRAHVQKLFLWERALFNAQTVIHARRYTDTRTHIPSHSLSHTHTHTSCYPLTSWYVALFHHAGLSTLSLWQSGFIWW